MKTWNKRMGLVVGLLSAFVIFIPSITTFARWQVRPGQAVQVISLIGTVSGRSTRNTASHGQGTSTIAIVAGDNGVHKSQINNTAMLIQSTSTRILRQSLGKLPTNKTEIFLYSNQTGYKSAVKKAFPLGQVSMAVRQTGGFTLGSKIYIPLYKYHSNAFLANTVTHELTHATLNENGIGAKLPTWMNEGLAWYDGTEAEMALDQHAAQRMTQNLTAQLEQAQKMGKLQPIQRDGGRVLEKNPPYNIEFQDYLGVKYLIQTYGSEKVTRLLSYLNHDSFSKSFSSVYPLSVSEFTASFTGERTVAKTVAANLSA